MYSTRALLDRYRTASNSVAFLRLLSESALANDDDLAHVISTHGRRADVLDLDLQQFFDAMPDLEHRPVALDAAIEAVLRSKRRSSVPAHEAAAELRRRFPHIVNAIDAAVILASVLGTADPAAEAAEEFVPPFDLGPKLNEATRRYGVRETLARGEQGSVYLAVDRALSERGVTSLVAIKISHACNADAISNRGGAAEAIRARQVAHRNVAIALDRGITDSGRVFSVFEYIDGGTLQDAVRSRAETMSLARAANTIILIARGVQAIHAAGILHRDLKPGNILMTRAGEPKVTDFGIAFEQFAPGHSGASPSIAGTLGFAAPEQLTPGVILNATCDTYALGGLLIYLITGSPANGSSIQEANLLLQPTNTPGPVNPSLIAKITDPTIAAICARATDRDAALRYQSAEALASDLERWLRNEPLLWLPTPRLQAFARWMRREWVSVVVIGSAALIAVLASSFVVAASNREAIADERAKVAAQQKATAENAKGTVESA